MRQIEFEIHAAFRLVMGIKICRQSEWTDTVDNGKVGREQENGTETKPFSQT